MPSLRRTASSPIVRSSPYAYSSSFNGAQAARGHGNRRSSGSETSNRRVLADIEWWRVTDGQCAAEQESEERNRDDVQNTVVGAIVEVVFFNAGAGVEHPSLQARRWPTALQASSTERSLVLPTAEFAALSITPQTPPQRHSSLASTSSSRESTPEVHNLSFEGLHLGLSDMDMGLFEDHLPPLSAFGYERGVSPPALARAHTFADCLSLQDDYDSCYDLDISPLLSFAELS